jgi:hypothetical protein
MNRVLLGALVVGLLALTGGVSYQTFLGPDRHVIAAPTLATATDDASCCPDDCPAAAVLKAPPAAPDCCDDTVAPKSAPTTNPK